MRDYKQESVSEARELRDYKQESVSEARELRDYERINEKVYGSNWVGCVKFLYKYEFEMLRVLPKNGILS